MTGKMTATDQKASCHSTGTDASFNAVCELQLSEPNGR